MRFLTIAVAYLWCLPVLAQNAASLNLNYLYNYSADVRVDFLPVVTADSVKVYFRISTNKAVKATRLQWEKRDSYNQRQGAVIGIDTINLAGGEAEGFLNFVKPKKPWLLVATVNNPENGKKWIFIRQIENHYPVNGFLEKGGKKIWSPYISSEGKYTIRGSGSGRNIRFSYYKENFPTPSPPFAEKELKMDRFLFPDSTFVIAPDATIGPFKQQGLYLAQEDTTAAEGFSFMVKSPSYPKYNTLGDLKGPLLFVTTREENDQIDAAGEDKAKFDQVILGITKDKDRAKNFMRNYFKRVELANELFTTFKDGWMTDRGMVYIVFGAPDIVTFDGQQEIWGYKNLGLNFIYSKAGTVYGPDHAVLVRDKEYTEYWYQTIDLWRKSRF